jgi:hypothetical protein
MYERCHAERRDTTDENLFDQCFWQQANSPSWCKECELRGKQLKRKLTNQELLEWGQDLAHGNDWDGIDADTVFRMMLDTAGNEYDAGDANWDFDESDAERLLELMNS